MRPPAHSFSGPCSPFSARGLVCALRSPAPCCSPSFPRDPPELRGFSPQAARAEREWEAKLQALPSTDSLREYMRRLSARPHHVGSPYDNANAEWLLSKFKEWGWQAQIETF